MSENGFKSIEFIQNDFTVYDNTALCGCRGWFLDGSDNFSAKIRSREEIRLEMSLKAAENAGFNDKIVFLHFPPVYKEQVCENMIALMKKYNVKKCYYGHLHGSSHKDAYIGNYDGIEFNLVSADFLKFDPLKIM